MLLCHCDKGMTTLGYEPCINEVSAHQLLWSQCTVLFAFYRCTFAYTHFCAQFLPHVADWNWTQVTSSEAVTTEWNETLWKCCMSFVIPRYWDTWLIDCLLRKVAAFYKGPKHNDVVINKQFERQNIRSNIHNAYYKVTASNWNRNLWLRWPLQRRQTNQNSFSGTKEVWQFVW